MENEVLTAINEIKTMLYFISFIVIVGLIAMAFLGYKFAVKFAKVTMSDKFKFEAEEMLDKECYDELIKHSKDLLQERPNHTYALWYLGKAYYNTEDYDNAKIYFEKIAKTNLEWRDNVEPYLDEINDL